MTQPPLRSQVFLVPRIPASAIRSRRLDDRDVYELHRRGIPPGHARDPQRRADPKVKDDHRRLRTEFPGIDQLADGKIDAF
jgi:hypothetical protein